MSARGQPWPPTTTAGRGYLAAPAPTIFGVAALAVPGHLVEVDIVATL